MLFEAFEYMADRDSRNKLFRRSVPDCLDADQVNLKSRPGMDFSSDNKLFTEKLPVEGGSLISQTNRKDISIALKTKISKLSVYVL